MLTEQHCDGRVAGITVALSVTGGWERGLVNDEVIVRARRSTSIKTCSSDLQVILRRLQC